jgi:hypothetical protein
MLNGVYDAVSVVGAVYFFAISPIDLISFMVDDGGLSADTGSISNP